MVAGWQDRRISIQDTRLFTQANEIAWTVLDGGNRRRGLAHTDELMQVEFEFEKGAVGGLHAHPHVQASYVAEGRFEVKVGDKTAIISKGGSFIVPSGVIHGVKALEKGRLIDCFTPLRADFLDK